MGTENESASASVSWCGHESVNDGENENNGENENEKVNGDGNVDDDLDVNANASGDQDVDGNVNPNPNGPGDMNEKVNDRGDAHDTGLGHLGLSLADLCHGSPQPQLEGISPNSPQAEFEHENTPFIFSQGQVV